MSADDEFVRHVLDRLREVGPVVGRRMFGGHGIFLDRAMFALVADQTLYLKADGQTRPRFEAAGLSPFVYYRQGKPSSLSYYQAPPECLEDRESLADWAALAIAAAHRAAAAKKPSTRRR